MLIFYLILSLFLLFSIEAPNMYTYGMQQIMNIIMNPISLFQPPPVPETSIFFICENPTTFTISTVQINDPEIKTKLDFNKSIAIFIHGWRTSAEDSMIKDTAIELSRQRHLNVCRVQWASISSVEYSRIVLQNMEIVSVYTTKFVQYLIIQGFTIEHFMCVGHSIGAHICGRVGSNFGGRIPLIISLDAAGLGFTFPFLAPPMSRLDTSDSKFVQAIHSCDFGAGTLIPIGHQDIYINSGLCSLQRGCNMDFSCAHRRSIDVFRHSLNATDKKCRTIKCANRGLYLLKQCAGGIEDYVGLDAEGYPGEFYLSVDEASNCRNSFYLY